MEPQEKKNPGAAAGANSGNGNDQISWSYYATINPSRQPTGMVHRDVDTLMNYGESLLVSAAYGWQALKHPGTPPASLVAWIEYAAARGMDLTACLIFFSKHSRDGAA